jgi:uncharacterized alpha-E superfamily protein
MQHQSPSAGAPSQAQAQSPSQSQAQSQSQARSGAQFDASPGSEAASQSPSSGPRRDPAIHRPPALLSRYAENLFWLGRYMERVENLARILDVTDTFVRHGADQSGWESVVRINADESCFFEQHRAATAETVLHFYLIDRGNPNSIVSSIFAARENARALRPLISTEMWAHINMFSNRVRMLTAADAAPSRVSALCTFLKESCQTHSGITQGTLFRDQGWAFYNIGKYLERGDQTSRLVDIKYHTLLPSVRDVGGAVDVAQWHALLRAASGYHAFRRVHPSDMTPALVAGFLLLNHSFPRSVVLCVSQIEIYLSLLSAGHGLRGAYAAQEKLDELRAALHDQPIEAILQRGLHEFMDYVQIQLTSVHNAIAHAFWRPCDESAAP